MTYHWRCSRCHTTYEPDAARYTCSRCGTLGILNMAPDYARIGHGWSLAELMRDQRRSLWRYQPLLPLQALAADADSAILNSALDSVGWTPLYHVRALSQRLGMPRLWIKDDGRNPTGSLKDRASALVLVKAQELGETVVATASTGNAAAALAGLSASIGARCVIFVPQSAPPAKMMQLLIYGAQVLPLDGSYRDAVELCVAACEEFGWYCRNTAYNPHTTEGKKTAALEICEQFGWNPPDTVVVAVGDGNIFTGLYRGFQDALGLGWIRHMPRLIGVQALKSPALYNAWQSAAADALSARAETCADSINVSLPSDGYRALHAAKQSGGLFTAVEEAAIVDATQLLAHTTGIFAEPASATAFAGLLALRERGEIGADERVVVVNTGTGLKDTRAAMQAVSYPASISPTLAAVRSALQKV